MRLKAKIIIFFLVTVAFSATLTAHKLRAPKRNFSDFHCFYTAGTRVLTHQNIYVLRDPQAAEFRYTPLIAVLMSALAVFGENTADTLWFILNFLLLVLTFILLGKLVFPPGLAFSKRLGIYLLSIFGIFRFILLNFDTGQTNILVLASLISGIYCLRKNRQIPAAALFGLAAMVKYTPLIFIPYFILRRRYKLTLLILGAISAYLLLPGLVIGWQENWHYLKGLPAFLTQSTIFDQMTVLDPKNQSLYSLWQRFFTRCVLYFHAPPMPFERLSVTPGIIRLIAQLCGLGLYIPILLGKQREEGAVLIDYALLLICVALFNLNAWPHNYIVLTLPYFILLTQLLTHPKNPLILGLLGASFALNFLSQEAIVGETFAYKALFYSPFAFSSLAAFLGLLALKSAKDVAKCKA
jgi:hypothetical protein